MARSKQTSQKTEKEKKKKLKQKEKEEKRAYRKANSNKGKGMEEMMAYVDHNGQLSDTPPDPNLKVEVKAEEIMMGPRSFAKENSHSESRTGRVAIYNNGRRFGFIKDSASQGKIFFHMSNAEEEIEEGDFVTFDLAHGPKGPSAINIVKITDPSLKSGG